MNKKIIALLNLLKQICSFLHGEKGNERFGLRHGLHGIDAPFAIIAIRCDDNSCTGKKNLKVGQIYQFLDGYTITEDGIRVASWRESQNLLYDDYTTENANEIPHVIFSAVVGKNGSGKSSVVELLMRVINNFAVHVFGELQSDPAAEKLRYIDDVCATLWYIMNDQAYRLMVKNQVVQIDMFDEQKINNEIVYVISSNTRIFGEHNDNSKDNPIHGLLEASEIKDALTMMFYTLISNYSLYAYNTHDYASEAVNVRKQELIDGFDKNKGNDVWLYSLFHKNDGYKVPIGITPYRSWGNIDVNTERELSKERLISLMVRNEEYRTVNKHLTALKLEIILPKEDAFGYEQIKSNLNFTRLTQQGYTRLRANILECWQDCIGRKFTKKSRKVAYEIALDYIVYKTLKVSKQYGEHNEFYSLLDMADDFPQETIRELVKSESEDRSHITRKIFQTIAYLLHDVYDLSNDAEENNKVFIDLDGIKQGWSRAKRHLTEKDYEDQNLIHIWTSALFVPPFCESDIIMCPDGETTCVRLEALSSGERQQLYTISSILYHLDNLNSIREDKFDTNRVFYPNITIVLEEIELYFHPEMQQSFVRYLLDGIHAISLTNLKSIHFILITHSPYVLSDIPRTNILAIEENEKPLEVQSIKTFGANIHDMLRTSFFLGNGAIGAFAQWEIKHISACLNIHYWVKTKNFDYDKLKNEVGEESAYEFIERYTTVTNDHKKYFEYNWFSEELGEEHLKRLIEMVDEPLLQNALERKYDIVFPSSERIKNEKRKRLLQQLKELDSDDTI